MNPSAETTVTVKSFHESYQEEFIMLNEINWPHEYLPGTTDNFASNEVIVKGINAAEVFSNLIDTSIWTSYYLKLRTLKTSKSSIVQPLRSY